MPAREKTAASNSNGVYTVDVSGLKPPFVLKAEGTDQTLYSISKNGGRANINPLSDTAVAASANDTDGGALYGMALYSMRSSDDEYRRTHGQFRRDHLPPAHRAGAFVCAVPDFGERSLRR